MENQRIQIKPRTEVIKTDQRRLAITSEMLGEFGDVHVRVISTTLNVLQINATRAVSLDTSGCPNLSALSCVANKLTALTTPDSLTHLDCQANNLSQLSLNEGLLVLKCSSNNLHTLTLPDSLIKLTCQYNKVAKLRLSKNLRVVDCSHNELRTLNANRKLRVLECNNNMLHSLYLNRGLRRLLCFHNRLTSLRLKRELKLLSCGDNPLYVINVDSGLQIRYYWERPADRTDVDLCTICRDPDGQQVMTNCGHFFHMDCIIHVLSGLCPNCRAPIAQSSHS